MFAFLSDDQNKHLEAVTKEYIGQMPTLGAALGAITIGHIYGWRVLKIVHSPATLKKYESIIGYKYEDLCPELTELSSRNVGFRMYQKIGAFWKVVLGQVKVLNKNEANDDVE